MDTRAEILRCAGDIYARDGLSGLSMRSIAQCVGVSAPAIYKHFDSKEALLTAVCMEGFEIFGRYLARGLRGKTPRERLDLTGNAYLDFAVEHRRYYTIMFMTPREHLGYLELAEGVENEAGPTFLFLVDRVRECMAAGELAEADPEAVAVKIWAATHGLASLFITNLERRFGDVESFRPFFRDALAALITGLQEEVPV